MIELPNIAIDFDEEKHLYTLGGYVLPSVTQIMEPMSLMLYKDVPPDALYGAADRGTRAHEQVSNAVLYGVLESDEDTEPYIKAFQQFQTDMNPKWLASEYRVYHQLLRYAGTLDLIGYIQPDDNSGVDVIDLKCTAAFHEVMLATQVSAYAQALESHGVAVRACYGLQLIKNGTYRFEKLGNGYPTFLHCLGLYNAMAAERRP